MHSHAMPEPDFTSLETLKKSLGKLEEALKKSAAESSGLYAITYNRKSHKELSLLHLAVLEQKPEAVRYLRSINIDPNKPYVNTAQTLSSWDKGAKRSALQDAIEQNSLEMVQALCDPLKSTPNSVHTAANITSLELYTAIAYYADQNILTYLLEGYHSKQRSYTLNQLLCLAGFYNNLPAITELISWDANPNITCKIQVDHNTLHLIPYHFTGTALTIAAQYGRADAVNLLIKLGVNCNTYLNKAGNHYRNGQGDSVLMITIREFIKLSISPHPQSEHNTYRSLFFKRIKIFDNRYNEVRYNIDVVNHDEHSTDIIFDQSQIKLKNYLNIIEILLQAGSNVHYRSGKNETLFDIIEPYKQKLPEFYQLFSAFMKNGLENSVSQKQNQTYYFHKLYAVITALNEKKERVILVGHPADNENIWSVPEGEVDYTIHENANGALIELVRNQTGINITHEPKKLVTAHHWEDEPTQDNNPMQIINTVELHHIELTGSAEHYLSILKKISNSRSESTAIQFVELNQPEYSAISMKEVDHPKYLLEDINFHSYQLHHCPFSLITSAILAHLQNKTINFIPAIKTFNVISQFSIKLEYLITSAFQQSSTPTINLLFELGLHKAYPFSFSSSLTLALEKKEYVIVSILLTNQVVLPLYDYNLLSQDICSLEKDTEFSVFLKLKCTHLPTIKNQKFIDEIFWSIVTALEHIVTFREQKSLSCELITEFIDQIGSIIPKIKLSSHVSLRQLLYTIDQKLRVHKDCFSLAAQYHESLMNIQKVKIHFEMNSQKTSENGENLPEKTNNPAHQFMIFGSDEQNQVMKNTQIANNGSSHTL